jgi:hypothetical protein
MTAAATAVLIEAAKCDRQAGEAGHVIKKGITDVGMLGSSPSHASV